MRKYLNSRANIALGLIFAFSFNSFGPIPVAQAQEFVLPKPGMMVPLSPDFNPPILKGIKVHSDNPFRFDFILDKGDTSLPDIKQESTKLIKYFLASLTIPEKDLWVNLSPYEKNRIVPESFGQTEMGRDLLAEDYMLKQITASLIYPEGETGKKFWKRIYEEAAKKFGTTNIPVNTFNKVWIVPEKAVVYENAKVGTAYVVESKLKVMLEQDYLALEKNTSVSLRGGEADEAISNSTTDNDVNALGSNIVREIVIPELDHEVNEGKNFSQLRQVYNSLILATWYKKKIRDSILAQVYENKNKIKGLTYSNKNTMSSPNALVGDPEHIYQRYLQAFKKGAYNYIKEDIDPITQQSISRKYFSGGFVGKEIERIFKAGTDKAMVDANDGPREIDVTVDFAQTGEAAGDLNGSKPAISKWEQNLPATAMLQGLLKGTPLGDQFKSVRFEVDKDRKFPSYQVIIYPNNGESVFTITLNINFRDRQINNFAIYRKGSPEFLDKFSKQLTAWIWFGLNEYFKSTGELNGDLKSFEIHRNKTEKGKRNGGDFFWDIFKDWLKDRSDLERELGLTSKELEVYLKRVELKARSASEINIFLPLSLLDFAKVQSAIAQVPNSQYEDAAMFIANLHSARDYDLHLWEPSTTLIINHHPMTFENLNGTVFYQQGSSPRQKLNGALGLGEDNVSFSLASSDTVRIHNKGPKSIAIYKDLGETDLIAGVSITQPVAQRMADLKQDIQAVSQTSDFNAALRVLPFILNAEARQNLINDLITEFHFSRSRADEVLASILSGELDTSALISPQERKYIYEALFTKSLIWKTENGIMMRFKEFILNGTGIAKDYFGQERLRGIDFQIIFAQDQNHFEDEIRKRSPNKVVSGDLEGITIGNEIIINLQRKNFPHILALIFHELMHVILPKNSSVVNEDAELITEGIGESFSIYAFSRVTEVYDNNESFLSAIRWLERRIVINPHEEYSQGYLFIETIRRLINNDHLFATQMMNLLGTAVSLRHITALQVIDFSNETAAKGQDAAMIGENNLVWKSFSRMTFPAGRDFFQYAVENFGDLTLGSIQRLLAHVGVPPETGIFYQLPSGGWRELNNENIPTGEVNLLVVIDNEEISQHMRRAWRKILVVDDGLEQRKHVEELLTKMGYKVVTAEDGEKALDLLTAKGANFSAVVSDWNMGGEDSMHLNGDILLTNIKKRVLLRDMPFIFRTSEPESVDQFGEEVIDKRLDSADEKLGKVLDKKLGIDVAMDSIGHNFNDEITGIVDRILNGQSWAKGMTFKSLAMREFGQEEAEDGGYHINIKDSASRHNFEMNIVLRNNGIINFQLLRVSAQLKSQGSDIFVSMMLVANEFYRQFHPGKNIRVFETDLYTDEHGEDGFDFVRKFFKSNGINGVEKTTHLIRITEPLNDKFWEGLYRRNVSTYDVGRISRRVSSIGGAIAELREIQGLHDDLKWIPQKDINNRKKILIEIFKMMVRAREYANSKEGQTALRLERAGRTYRAEGYPTLEGLWKELGISYADHAMNSNLSPGGIDLTSDKALSVQNSGQAITFHIDQAMLEQLQNAPGFTPVIINIQPMINLKEFLGINN